MKSIIPFLILCLGSCQIQQDTSQNLLTDIDPKLEGQWVNMVVEIPAGTTEKWEVNKKTGEIERDSLDGEPRTINYLGYPGNYGFIPQTLLPKEQGGDGDPLDVIVIGESRERGTILRCKIIGVLKLMDRGEQDDKLIAIAQYSPLADLSNPDKLRQGFPGIIEMIEIWFVNYKGRGAIKSKGFEDSEQALKALEIALKAYQKELNKSF